MSLCRKKIQRANAHLAKPSLYRTLSRLPIRIWKRSKQEWNALALIHWLPSRAIKMVRRCFEDTKYTYNVIFIFFAWAWFFMFIFLCLKNYVFNSQNSIETQTSSQALITSSFVLMIFTRHKPFITLHSNESKLLRFHITSSHTNIWLLLVLI